MALTAWLAVSSATYAIDRPYSYLLPDALTERARPGMRVLVPFGRGNRTCDGVILAIRPEEAKKCKRVITLLDEEPMLEEWGIQLALWMSRRYFCTVYECIRAMLPAGLWFSLQDSYRLAPEVTPQFAQEQVAQSPSGQQIINLVVGGGGDVPLTQIRTAFGLKDPMPTLRRLVSQQLLVLETSASRGVGDKTEKVATLVMPPEEALGVLAAKQKTAPLQYSVAELLAGVGEATVKDICYFTGASTATIRAMVKKGLIALTEREVFRQTTDPAVVTPRALTLNDEQERAYRGLEALCREGKAAAALLYGITGSGKTQVYLKLIEFVLAQGKNALVLVPEIALTPQLLRIFTGYFGGQVTVLHSALSAGQRYDGWKLAKNGTARVVLGTRSAIFAPVHHLGLIILDEEQESSYKSEQAPRYHAREVAKYRCSADGGLLLLGSATPSVETMYLANEGKYHQFTLSNRYNQKALPQVTISDMKDHLRMGNDSDIGTHLQQALAANISRGEQSILFLNRRGARRMATCQQCGQVPTCPRCSVYLTYHSANNRLMCHHCGHSQLLPQHCPTCDGLLTFVGSGTQRLQATLEELFPNVEVMRMDADTISATQSHQRLFDRFVKKKVPILVGTQMVAKGLDFENVTLVGVIAADSGLYLEDYRAAERTFSLITQVVGRAGRGDKEGRAVIQTFTPDNDVIAYAAAQDYDGFYQQEIHLRMVRGVPPFFDLFVLTASGEDEMATLTTCQRLRNSFEATLTQEPYCQCAPRLLGPAPAAVAKVNNRYRYRLTLSCKGTGEIRRLIAHLLRCAQLDKGNRGVSIFADYNPMD